MLFFVTVAPLSLTQPRRRLYSTFLKKKKFFYLNNKFVLKKRNALVTCSYENYYVIQNHGDHILWVEMTNKDIIQIQLAL